MHKKNLLTLGLTTLGLLTASLSANAAVFNFSYTGTGISAAGQLTTDAAGTLITSITGQRNGVDITSLLAPGTFPILDANDNAFIPSGNPAFLTFAGLSYEVVGGDKYNFFYDSTNALGFGVTYLEADVSLNSIPVTATFTPVPEPSMVFGFVALGIGAVLKRKLG